MAALVQTIPQQAGTITLLQTRPSSSSAAFSTTLQHHSQHHSQAPMARDQSNPRAAYHGGHPAPTGYRTSQPVAPYAFTSTPGLSNVQSRQYTSPPTQSVTAYPGIIPPRAHFTTAGSVSNTSSSNSSLHSHRSKDDSSLPNRHANSELKQRPLSALDLTLPSPPGGVSSSSAPSKPSPDRYRRGPRRTDQPALSSHSNLVSMGQGQTAKPQPTTAYTLPPTLEQRPFGSQHTRVGSADDALVDRSQGHDLAKRYRRRSLGSLDTAGLVNFAESYPSPHANELLLSEFPLTNIPPATPNAEARRVVSSSSSVESDTAERQSVKSKSDQSSHTSKSAEKRATVPSPLSKPVTLEPDEKSGTDKKSASPSHKQPEAQSPATKRLIEISKKGGRKSSKSRLRRALSFSSVAELRGASSPNPPVDPARKQQLDEELGPEQAAIAVKQEASGLGESIYSGQGRIFSGSTDNISVSSTASSASIMLRKMGNGVKRSTRSLVGLFRPNSKLNAPIEPSHSEPMVPQVSMVTVEAQRDSSNSTGLKPSETVTAKTVEPVKRASVDSTSTATDEDGHNPGRQSIFGGEQERAEVLAAVKKGILKKPTYNIDGYSPKIRPNGADSPRPQGLRRPDSSRSSCPSTPGEDRPPRSGHRRTDSVTLEGEDYFLPAGRFNSSAQSAPGTPQSASPRNISFSPRIQFHDTWPSGEYDRRGDVATCNRLTPLLAQQIKEELNTFKMEMEVHESSKIYTHFF
ncbi:bud neck involved protein [Myotisia sp. PD_48]|nr:bud neck involved protein [Myotisia sp. PD_48]